MSVEPRTPQEWQQVVDLCHVLLAIDSARAYGLVRGGPEVNVERCAALLKRGCRLGYAPAVDAIERLAGGLL